MEQSSTSQSPTLVTDDTEMSASQSPTLVAEDTEMSTSQSPTLVAFDTEMSEDERFIQTNMMNIMKDTQNITRFTRYKTENAVLNRHSRAHFSDFKQLTVTAETDYNLVLKCSEKPDHDEDRAFIRSLYKRAILLYTEILPQFTHFEGDKGIQTPFDNIPKFYGTYMDDDDNQMIIQGDLTKEGYTILPQLEPVEHSKLEVLLRTLGRWHAISTAMAVLRPDDYRKIIVKLDNANERTEPIIEKIKDDVRTYVRNMHFIRYELLENQMYVSESLKWIALQKRVSEIVYRFYINLDPFKVVLHGDIQSSNIMFKGSHPVILDWKFSYRNSPVYDVADLIFTCAGAEDLLKLDELLKIYHRSFTDHMKKLGISEPSYFYSRADFMRDWENIAEYSVIRSFTIMKNMFSLPLSVSANYEKDGPKPTRFDHCKPHPNFNVPMYHLKKLAERCLDIFRSANIHGLV